MRSKRRVGVRVTLALTALLAVIATGCGDSDDSSSSSSSKTQTVDVGNGTIEVDSAPRSVAMFVAGSAAGYTFTAALEDGAKRAAEQHGIDLKIYEANFDAAAQYSQIQSALTSGRYDGLVIQPASAQSCRLVREAALEQDLLVSVVGATLCGKDDQTGDRLWEPGTLTFVGGQYGVPGFTAFAEGIVEANPGPQKAIQVIGPKEYGVTKGWFKAVDPVFAANPEFEIVATVYTDYTTPDAFRKTQDALQGNPDAGIVISQYVDLTRGVVRAAKALGRDVKIYDFGASAESVELIEEGTVLATFPTYPLSMGSATIDAIVSAARGDSVPRFIEKDGNPDAITTVLDKSAIDSFEPQY